MRRVTYAFLSSCLLVSLGVFTIAAQAGEYSDGGYRRHHSGNVTYSSHCCYKKIVRHERTVRYKRIDEERSYYRDGYNDRPRHSYRDSYREPTHHSYRDDSYRDGYSARPYRSYRQTYYNNPQRRHVADSYVSRRYVDRSYYATPRYTNYSDNCYPRRARMWDGRGGWVWGVRSGCY